MHLHLTFSTVRPVLMTMVAQKKGEAALHCAGLPYSMAWKSPADPDHQGAEVALWPRQYTLSCRHPLAPVASSAVSLASRSPSFLPSLVY